MAPGVVVRLGLLMVGLVSKMRPREGQLEAMVPVRVVVFAHGSVRPRQTNSHYFVKPTDQRIIRFNFWRAGRRSTMVRAHLTVQTLTKRNAYVRMLTILMCTKTDEGRMYARLARLHAAPMENQKKEGGALTRRVPSSTVLSIVRRLARIRPCLVLPLLASLVTPSAKLFVGGWWLVPLSLLLSP
jgi:hypothetical protein